MIRSLKNWSSQNKDTYKKQERLWLTLLFIFFLTSFFAQVNFVGNPSLENVNCTNPNYLKKAYYWNGIDSTKIICGGGLYHSCFNNVPYGGPGLYQKARTGTGFVRVTFYNAFGSGRTYPKNRLLNNLTAGKTYCVKMYVNLQNNSPNSLSDELAIYLADVSSDTISQCGSPISYLNPQIKNPIGNFITDTLGWVEVSGTFTATGNEKYLIIGNFKTDAASTPSVTWNPPSNWSEYNVDDVSVIDFNLPAFAGSDQNIALGDSAFIGRPPEIGLECTWTIGTTTIGTGGGIWVKPPLGTYTYVVTQNICGNIKNDTVTVNVGPSGINENIFFEKNISIYPQPARDILNISMIYYYEPTIRIRISDVNGKIIHISELLVRNGQAQLETSELSDGIYILQLISKDHVTHKRVIITK